MAPGAGFAQQATAAQQLPRHEHGSASAIPTWQPHGNLYNLKHQQRASTYASSHLAGTVTASSAYGTNIIGHCGQIDACQQALLLTVLQLSDQWQFPGVMQAVMQQLTRLFSYQLTWDAALRVLWLPPSLLQQAPLLPLLAMARTRLLQELGSLDAVLACSGMRSALQRLPASAAAWLLSSDQLRVASENSVLTAADVWARGPIGSLASAAELTQVAATVRLPLVSGALLGAAARRLDWLCASLASSQCQSQAGCSAGWQRDVTNTPELGGAASTSGNEGCTGMTSSDARGLSAGDEGWPLLAMMAHYYMSSPEHRLAISQDLLGAGLLCPWSARQRLGRPTSSAAVCISAVLGMSQLRRMADRHAADSYHQVPPACAVDDDGSDSERLVVGEAYGSGYVWRASLLATGAESGGKAWRLGLLLQCKPALGAELQGRGATWPRWTGDNPLGTDGASAAPADGHLTAAGCGADGVVLPAAVIRARQHLLDIAGCKSDAAVKLHGTSSARNGLGELLVPVIVRTALQPVMTRNAAGRGAGADVLDAAARTEPLTEQWTPLVMRQGSGHGAERVPDCAVTHSAFGSRRGSCPAGVAEHTTSAVVPCVLHSTFDGWQPHVWAAIAPSGQVQLHCSVMLLTD